MYKIEILYPEVANLYGDHFNAELLRRSYPDDIEVKETHLNDEPLFPSGCVDLIYMGAMPEKYQDMAIELLRPYTDALKNYIESGKPALFTGNSFEILGEYIQDADRKIPCLGIYKGYAVRDMMNRYNSMYLGEVAIPEGPLKIVGFKSQFSKTFGLEEGMHFIHTLRERDEANSSVDEGVRINNFFGTYLTGPFLIMNPKFGVYLLSLMGIQNPKLVFEEELVYSYEKRLEEALNSSTNFAV